MKKRSSSPSDFACRTRRACLAAAVLPALLTALPAVGGNGSLWRDEAATSLLADTRARAVGDIITIVVQENNEATKQNNTQTSRASGISAAISSFLFGAGQDRFLTRGGRYPAMEMNSENTFNGGGSINNSERLNARIASRVVEVQPNGNLVLEGRRQTFVSGDQQEAILRGVVRQEDIRPNNTVFSFNVADATIKFVTKGTVSDQQRKGWFLKVWDKLAPF
jgi:flagellar L-ring protein FlgH